ncbi:MAG: pilus assembly protein PilM, partial [Planctomycetes bacterium]|nr:pilus assembly protein PilM [Planctomycetota bacterium]
MARSCGLRLGPRRFELVVLEGNSKKHKIIAYYAGEFDQGVEDPGGHAVELLKDAAKAHRIPTDNLGLVIDSGTSAFRHLSLPISDRSKLEQVIKYEVEGELPQWNIDDVVVDYHVLEEEDDESKLLITAVPKEDVQAALQLVERAGLEPLEVQLETSAMVNAATNVSLCGPEEAQLLVHVGDLSTSVVVMDGGNIREMRVIHIGALTHELNSAGAPPAEGEEEGEHSAPAIDPVEQARRLD